MQTSPSPTIWTRLVHAGIPEDASAEHVESVRILHVTCLLSIAIAGALAIIQFTLGIFLFGGASSTTTLGFVIAYLLSRRGYHRFGAIVGFTVLTVVVGIIPMIQGPGLFETVIVGMVAMAFLLFQHWGMATLMFVIATLFVVAMLSQFASFIPVEPLALSSDLETVLRGLFLVGSFAFVAAIQWYYLRARKHTMDQLRKALIDARAANVAKSEFLANTSHEIRTPMNGILGMLGILQDAELKAEHREFVDAAHSSGLALLDILNDILDLSKIESGHLSFELVPFDLMAMLEDILEQMVPQISSRDVELLLRYDVDAPRHVIADPGRVRQVLINLIGNAIKFTERGHVLVTIAGASPGDERMATAAPTVVEIRVEDTGIGIPAHMQQQIFDKFKQVDGSTKRAYMGTGLGLAIAKELVERMGGTIDLRSELGRGTTFQLHLPMEVDSHPPPVTPISDDLSGLRVLIIDDHPINRLVLRERLARWHIEHGECDSGEAAIDVLCAAHASGAPYDMALIDFHMPAMDGIDTARAIKQIPELSRVVLIMASSLVDRVDSRTLLDAGYVGYLTKPLRHQDVLDIMAHAWQSRAQPQRLITRHTILGASESRERSGAVRANPRVLVVEDNHINQKVARRMLENLGCRVDVAGNGLEALEMIAAAPYQLVFMDVQMPEMDGLEATRVLRAERPASAPVLPIVAMTAHAMSGDRERFLSLGMNDYVAKPIRRAALINVLKRFVWQDVSSYAGAQADVSDAEPADIPPQTNVDRSDTGDPHTQSVPLHPVID